MMHSRSYGKVSVPVHIEVNGLDQVATVAFVRPSGCIWKLVVATAEYQPVYLHLTRRDVNIEEMSQENELHP